MKLNSEISSNINFRLPVWPNGHCDKALWPSALALVLYENTQHVPWTVSNPVIGIFGSDSES